MLLCQQQKQQKITRRHTYKELCFKQFTLVWNASNKYAIYISINKFYIITTFNYNTVQLTIQDFWETCHKNTPKTLIIWLTRALYFAM